MGLSASWKDQYDLIRKNWTRQNNIDKVFMLY
jgi:hypothetical protein